MTKKILKTAQELKNDWGSIKSERISKAEKRPKVEAIRGGVQEIERAAVSDWSFPFSEVLAARDLLQELDEWLRGAVNAR